MSPPAPHRLVLGTGNVHKVPEIAAVLAPDWEVVSHDLDVEETGATFEVNALLKARAVRDATGEVAVADDSGIEIDALDGRPGIHSARWTDEQDWIPRVLRELDGVPAARRTCRYVCAAAVARPDGTEAVVRGEVEGRIASEPRGTGGFGYDPIIEPLEGDGRTFGEMTVAEKQALSHRTRAFRALRALL
ncbi:MAG: RdgB/HAM1 family non-canonical purine NTP pyrophosphatase [Actinomycetota bacterium]|nr:RdgB/HAM1 family non-canonical purine NTP pyrophosphatase [Acidimicrobiia bacterium]MDQ3292998.1 RdgB/HAM1 family non-canonical purine NTP pyrophosphatase [Actinomycetota bacterium]